MTKNNASAANTATSYAISNDRKNPLYLVQVPVSNEHLETTGKPPQTHHVLMIDCSYSMCGELPQIRKHINAKLASLLNPGDLISIIWFSGRGQCDVLVNAVKVDGPESLRTVSVAVDRWLRPVGCTGFVDPLRKTIEVVECARKDHPNAVVSAIFVSDGYDNEWRRDEILAACAKLSGVVNATTIVEYACYADRNLLTAMAEKAGGALIFASDFTAYAPVLEGAMGKRASAAKRKPVPIVGDAVCGFAYALHDGDLLTYGVEIGKVASSVDVRADLETLYYLSPSIVGTLDKRPLADLAKGEVGAFHGEMMIHANHPAAIVGAAYAAVNLYANRLQGRTVDALLGALGDKALAKQYGRAIGKDKVSAFVASAYACAFTNSGGDRWADGYVENCVPPSDAPTMLHLLDLLASDPNNRLLLDHPAFSYNAIGRKRDDASETLTDNEKKEIDKLTASIAGKTDVATIKAVQVQIDTILNAKGPALKFVPDPAPDGYSIANIVTAEERPNISVKVFKPGTIDISARVPLEHKNRLPTTIAVGVWRNYAIVRDGLVNVAKLPVRVVRDTWDKLIQTGVTVASGTTPVFDGEFVTAVLDLEPVPIVNRDMVRDISAKALFEAEYKLLLARADQKVYGDFKKRYAPKALAKGFLDAYGTEATEWLKSVGITDSGFAPKSTVAESTDFYMATEVLAKLGGYSSLPSVNDVIKKRTRIDEYKKAPKGKEPAYTAGEALLLPTIEVCEAMVVKHGATGAGLLAWLEQKAAEATKMTRQLISEAARTKFSITVGGAWPKEWKTLDENKITIEVKGQNGKPAKLDGTLELRQVKQLI